MSISKEPIHHSELEESVLGAILIESEAIKEIINYCSENYSNFDTEKLTDIFYTDKHKLIFKACLDAYLKTGKMDMVIVTAKLRESNQLANAGGASYIMKLTSYVNSASHIIEHLKYIIEAYIKRKLSVIGFGLNRDAYEHSTDVFDTADKYTEQLFNLNNLFSKTDSFTESHKAVDLFLDSYNQKENSLRLTTGYESIDNLVGNFEGGDFVVMGARPSNGKTAFGLNLCRNFLLQGYKGCFFSLESTKVKIYRRIASMESFFHQTQQNPPISYKYLKNNLTNYELDNISRLLHYNFYNDSFIIDDNFDLSIKALGVKLKFLKQRYGISYIMIDYLQIMQTAKAFNRVDALSEISRGLVKGAKENDIVIFALAQLSREADKTPEKMPLVSHLKECGQIEQDASHIFILRYPEHDEINTWNFYGDEISTKDIMLIDITKNKESGIGLIRMEYKAKYNAIKDYFEI